MKNQKGFTLVELMVVLVIIGILATLAIPKFGALSGKAKLAEAPAVISGYEALQNSYVVETGALGTAANIGWAAPSPVSKYWTYTTGADAITGTAQSAMGDCEDDGTLISTASLAASGGGADFAHSGTCEADLPSFKD